MINLTDRVKRSGFPLSIGTGLALETLFKPTLPVIDPERLVPEALNRDRYNLFLVNINTLIRNLLNAIETDDYIRDISADKLLEILIEEYNFIKEMSAYENIRIQFYINSYHFAKQAYGSVKNKLRVPITPKQIWTAHMTDHCLAHFKKDSDVKYFTAYIKGEKDDDAVILTHTPWDLLGYKKFNSLELLESHTGIIKDRSKWNSKYYPVPGEDMSFLPFMEYLLTVFGDHVMFSPDGVKKRQDLLKQLKLKRVHPLMSEVSLNFILG